MASRCTAALIVTFAMISSGFAADVRSSLSKEGKVVIALQGEIVIGDADQVKAAIKTANDVGRTVSGIRLTSPGGNLLEGVKLAEAIRFAKIASVVPNGSTCASACFLAFAAGVEKYVSFSANVGVHGASDQNGRETVQAGAATVQMARVARELGTPSSVIGQMVITPPNQMVWLTPNDLRAMGTTMTGKPTQTTDSQSLAQTAPGVAPVLSAANPALTWAQLVNSAVKASESQNGGKAETGRVCQPEQKTCSTAVFFRNASGDRVMLRAAEDLSGNVFRREICKFNSFGDVRTCVGFEGGSDHKDMKDASGNWQRVE